MQTGNALRLEASALEYSGRSLVLLAGLALVIPAAWAYAWFYRWFVGQLRFDDGTRARWVGQASDLLLACVMAAVTWLNLAGLWLLPAWTSNAIAVNAYSAGGSLLNAALAWSISRTLIGQTESSTGHRLSFTGSFGGYLAWNLGILAISLAYQLVAALLAREGSPTSAFAALGLLLLFVAAMMFYAFAFYSWIFRHIEGGRTASLKKDWFGLTWRVMAAGAGSAFILPAPWLIM